ncbi:hypothetical protein BJ165DRAFT_1468934 [Panaeolus papilionaceus]|nr:hypothetical protein BJ165DRAFT_1468934 [Panaeolus papilionaceus]
MPPLPRSLIYVYGLDRSDVIGQNWRMLAKTSSASTSNEGRHRFSNEQVEAMDDALSLIVFDTRRYYKLERRTHVSKALVAEILSKLSDVMVPCLPIIRSVGRFGFLLNIFCSYRILCSQILLLLQRVRQPQQATSQRAKKRMKTKLLTMTMKTSW